jgi:3-oxoacyl-[acyl-carrier protein] reductase
MTDCKNVILVTGATRGIGKSIACSLVCSDNYIVGTATSERGAESITNYMKELKINGIGRVLDVTNGESVNNLISEISDSIGPPTILVNNAGITRDQLLMRMNEEDWDNVLETNLKSIYRLSKACLRGMMKNRWGRIINVGSVVGSMGNSGQSNYSASKSGVQGFSRALAREVGSRNITVNTVSPGFIETDMTSQLPEEGKKIMLEKIPLGRMGSPQEVACVVKFLASSSGDYITGETIHVNGGLYMS